MPLVRGEEDPMTMHEVVRRVGAWVAVLTAVFGATAVAAGDVVAWIPYARITPEYDNVVAILGFRPTETTTTDPAELDLLLAGRPVLLIPEQSEAEERALEELGLATATVLTGFLAQGGRIVGLTYSQGAEDILRGAGLWAVTDDYNVTGGDIAIALPTDPLARDVPARYEGPDGSTDFANLPRDAVVVAWDTVDEAPVVFRWETRGGTVVMLGFDCYEYNDATAQLLTNAVEVALGTPVEPAADNVVQDLGPADIEDILIQLGYTFDRRTDDYGDPAWVIYLNVATVALFVDDPVEDAPGRYQYLQLYAGWLTGGATPCEVVNAWNQAKRGSRAYLDEDGDVALEADLYLRGGVTRDTIAEFLERFERILPIFLDHLHEG